MKKGASSHIRKLDEEVKELGYGPTAPTVTAPTTNAWAVACLLLSLFGALFGTFFFGLAAIVCGHIARSQIRKSRGSQSGFGVALVGLIIAYVSVLFLVLTLVGLVAAVLAALQGLSP